MSERAAGWREIFTGARRFRWLGFIPQLFVLTILPLTALLLVITFGSLALHQRAMRDMAGEQDLRAVRASASALNAQINHRVESLQNLSWRAQDGASLEQILTQGSSPNFDGGMAFAARDGTILAATTAPGLLPLDAVQLEAFLADLPVGAERAPVFSEPLLEPLSQKTFILAAVNSGPDRVVIGAFSPASLAAQTLGTAYSHSTAGSHYLGITLVDGRGRVLYASGYAGLESDLSTRPGFSEALRGESGVTYTRLAGNQVVVAFSPVAPLGWALILEEPWEAMASPLLLTTQTMPLVLVPALLLALVGLWFGAKQVIQPLQRLEAQANELSWGRFEVVQHPVGGIAEIQRLQVGLAEMARKVQASQENLRSYVGAITAGQEEERRRLAREIHDDTLQAVIALNQRVQLAQMSLGEHPARASLEEIQGLTEGTIANLRRLVRALRPAYLEELGLPAALDMLAKEMGQVGGIPVAYACKGVERRLNPEVELALYRMVQECLSNITRHAHAKQGWLTIAFLPDAVKVTAQDDGRGFKMPENLGDWAQAGHFGVLGLFERADLIGANLDLQSSPGKGTRVEITLLT